VFKFAAHQSNRGACFSQCPRDTTGDARAAAGYKRDAPGQNSIQEDFVSHIFL
jgi:hypothetical protein